MNEQTINFVRSSFDLLIVAIVFSVIIGNFLYDMITYMLATAITWIRRNLEKRSIKNDGN